MEYVVKIKLPETTKKVDIKVTSVGVDDKEMYEEFTYTKDELEYLKNINKFNELLP